MDRTRISQVVTNLLENAIGHTPEGGTVSLTAEAGSPSMARITVADTGEGLPPDELSSVFDRLYQDGPLKGPRNRRRRPRPDHRQAAGRGPQRHHNR